MASKGSARQLWTSPAQRHATQQTQDVGKERMYHLAARQCCLADEVLEIRCRRTHWISSTVVDAGVRRQAIHESIVHDAREKVASVICWCATHVRASVCGVIPNLALVVHSRAFAPLNSGFAHVSSDPLYPHLPAFDRLIQNEFTSQELPSVQCRFVFCCLCLYHQHRPKSFSLIQHPASVEVCKRLLQPVAGQDLMEKKVLGDCHSSTQELCLRLWPMPAAPLWRALRLWKTISAYLKGVILARAHHTHPSVSV